MRNLGGESDRGLLRAFFDRRLKFEFHGSRITSDAGLLAYRELDEALGLTTLAGDVIADSRTGKNGWHGIIGLLRQSVYGRLAGYEDVNDADRLGRDPAMRWIVGGRAVERGYGASTSQMGRFETELLATNDNLAALADLLGIWIDQVNERKPPKIIVLDMDSSASPTYGDQEGTAYNGVTSAARAITRCSCSTSSAIWSVAPCVRATCTAPMNGAMCWTRWSLDTGTRHSGVISVVTPPSPRPRFMSFWKRKASSTPSGFRPTRCCTTASRTCSSAPSVGRRRKFVGITRTSAIGPVAGRSPAGSSPRWSGTQGNCIPASALIIASPT